MYGFFASFLDGFTGAGIARMLSVPGEPILGFAPIANPFPDVVIANLRNSKKLINLRRGRVELRVLEIRLDAKSGNLVSITESASGKVRKVHVEGNALPGNLSSVLDGPTI
jgi:hypothetical protein